MADGTFWNAQLGGVFGGHKWLLAYDVLASSAPRVRRLLALGADRPFVLAGHRGMGEIPTAAEAETAVLGGRAKTMMEAIRAAEAGFADPGPEVAARIEAWDPERRARVLGTIFATGQHVCGRRYFGGRPVDWLVLEDKIGAEAIWDAAGVERAPAEVVPPTEQLLEAASRLDRGKGTVWSGDMREGFNGGAEYVRWVRDGASAAEARAFFETHCDRVRVMPFLDGIPCSIHGVVFADTVIALRPCEMVVLRSVGSSRFRYASAATFWEPDPEDAAAMREVALRVGAYLRDRVDYRGAFTVDGVMTIDGFRPTELNPRVGAALMQLAGGVSDLNLDLLNLALVARVPFEWRPAELERVILQGSRERRRASASVVVEVPVAGEHEVELAFVHGTCRRAGEGDPADVHLALGEHPVGGFLRVGLSPDLTPVGPPVAERVAAALRWADREWQLGIGPIRAAPDLRPAHPGAPR